MTAWAEATLIQCDERRLGAILPAATQIRQQAIADAWRAAHRRPR